MHYWVISYCCRPTLIAKVAGQLLSRITWPLLKLLVIGLLSAFTFYLCIL